MSNVIPHHWKVMPLSELLVSLESGSRPRGGVRGISHGIPSVGGEHLKYDGTFDFSSIKYVPNEFANKMTKGRIRINDILVVKDGAGNAAGDIPKKLGGLVLVISKHKLGCIYIGYIRSNQAYIRILVGVLTTCLGHNIYYLGVAGKPG